MQPLKFAASTSSYLGLRRLCCPAARMLSTRFRYRRPARRAEALAFRLLLPLSFVCRLFFGAAFFQGALRDDDFFRFPGMQFNRARTKSWLCSKTLENRPKLIYRPARPRLDSPRSLRKKNDHEFLKTFSAFSGFSSAETRGR